MGSGTEGSREHAADIKTQAVAGQINVLGPLDPKVWTDDDVHPDHDVDIGGEG